MACWIWLTLIVYLNFCRGGLPPCSCQKELHFHIFPFFQNLLILFSNICLSCFHRNNCKLMMHEAIINGVFLGLVYLWALYFVMFIVISGISITVARTSCWVRPQYATYMEAWWTFSLPKEDAVAAETRKPWKHCDEVELVVNHWECSLWPRACIVRVCCLVSKM